MPIRHILIGLLAVLLLLSCESTTEPEVNPLSPRGDINQNGTAYEIADAIALADYIVQHGTSASACVPSVTGFWWQAGFRMASDLNADGIPATLCDLVYMTRIVVGDAAPYDGVDLRLPAPVAVQFSTRHGVCSVGGEMGAALVTLRGDIEPQLLANRMDLRRYFDGKYTRVLVWSLYHDILRGDFLAVPEDSIVDIELATFNGHPAEPKIEDLAVGLICYPDRFVDSLQICVQAPAPLSCSLTIRNVFGRTVWSQSRDVEEAGVDCFYWDGSGLMPGKYTVTLLAANRHRTTTLLKLPEAD